MYLSSHSSPKTYTDQDLITATKPAANIVSLLYEELNFPDKSYAAVMSANDIIDRVISCFEFDNYNVAPITGTLHELHFKVEIKPFKDSTSFVSFIAKLRVQG